MKFSCERCGRSYTVADELRGRAFKMKCKSCDYLIVVKPTTGPAGKPPPPQPVPPPSSRATSKISYLAKDRPPPEPSPGLPERPLAAPAKLVTDSIEPPVPEPTSPPPDEPLFSAAGAPSFVLPSAPPPASLTLIDSGSPAEETGSVSDEPPVDEAVAAVLEAAMGSSPPETALGGVELRAGLKDPFADLEHEHRVPSEPPPRTGPAPRASPVPPPEVGAPPEGASSTPAASPSARVAGLPKIAVYGAAAGLVVVLALVLVLAMRGGKPPGSSTASAPTTGQPASLAPGLRVIITQPELAAPDPQLLAAEAAKKAAAAPSPGEGQGKQPGEGGLQGRPVTPPAEKLPHRLERADVLRVVDDNRAAINGCLAEAVKRDASLEQSGRMLDLVLTVNPSGKVGMAAVDDAQLAETPLAPCLAAAVQGMVFPRFQGDPQPIRVPLTFGDVK